MSGQRSSDVFLQLLVRLRVETKSWFGLLGLVFGLFVLTLSFISLLQAFFDFRLLPEFQIGLDGFREFTHLLLGKTIYAALSALIAYSVLAITFIGSFVLPIKPFLPTIYVPLWLKDLGLISMVLLRAETQAMKYSNPASTLTLTPRDRVDWEWALLNAPTPLRFVTIALWTIAVAIYRVKKFSGRPFGSLGFVRTARLVEFLVGGVLLLGIVYFLHDTCSILATTRMNSDRARSHRQFFLWTITSLGCALVASLIFLMWNGFLLS